LVVAVPVLHFTVEEALQVPFAPTAVGVLQTGVQAVMTFLEESVVVVPGLL
jgi:hypothetical protein